MVGAWLKLLLAHTGAAIAGLPAIAFALALFTMPTSSAELPRIGVLAIGSLDVPPLNALVQGLGALGHVNGRTIAIEFPPAQGSFDALGQRATYLVQSKVKVIVTYGATATFAARDTNADIPIVMVIGGDPIQLGVAASLARPGGNVTGIAALRRELTGKRLELLKDTIPGLKRVAFLLNASSATEPSVRPIVEAAARTLSITVQSFEIHSAAEFATAFAAMSQSGAEAVLLGSSSLLQANSLGIAKLALEHRLPSIGPDQAYAHAGGFMSYGTDVADNFRHAAHYVDRILKGAKPADMPIEQPTHISLVVNLKAAVALGLAVPAATLARADEVIE